MKPDSEWSFKSKAKGVDGDRVIKEALEEGLQVLEVRRGKDIYVFLTKEYVDRIEAVDLLVNISHISYAPALRGTGEGLLLQGRASMPTACRYAYFYKCGPNQRTPRASLLVWRLWQAENNTLRTHVRGWK